MSIVRLALIVIALYLAIGVVFAVPFVVGWVGRYDPAARGTGWGFRLLIIPGSAVFWPLIAFALIAGRLRDGGGSGAVVAVRESG